MAASEQPHARDVRLLMLGAPGSGKGTQGDRIAQRYGARHISTGDLLRVQVAEQTHLGRQAQPYMERGDLVPDELILDMVLDHVLGQEAPPSFVLDGFPRTVTQARAAYERAAPLGRTLHAVLWLDLDENLLVQRLEQRRRQTARVDDTHDTVRHRIHEYQQKTMPLLDYYADRDLVLRVDASGTIDEVTEQVFAAVDALPTE